MGFVFVKNECVEGGGVGSQRTKKGGGTKRGEEKEKGRWGEGKETGNGQQPGLLLAF